MKRSNLFVFICIIIINLWFVWTTEGLHREEHQCHDRNNIVVTFSGGMGYRNQMDTVSKAIFVGFLTNRSVCMPHFSSDFRSPPDIAPHYFIDMNETNQKLAMLHSSVSNGLKLKSIPPVVTSTSDIAKKKCVCLLLQGEGAPAGPRRCTYGSRSATLLIRDMDSNYTNLLDFIQRPKVKDYGSLCLSPGMPFNEPIRSEHESLYRKIQRSLVHHGVMYSIANYVKSREGVCEGKCSGDEIYISTHVRLENDFISQLQMLTGYYQKRGINLALNNAIIDEFLHDFEVFLKEYTIDADLIHISSGLGKTENHQNNFLIKNYYEKRYRTVSTYHYEYLSHVTEIARHVNHSTHVGGDVEDISDPFNVSHHISKNDLITFHHILSGIDKKKSRMRDFHAITDFLIASQATFFYGVCASSFTEALKSYVDISGCFKENSQRLHNLTKNDFDRISKKINTLRDNSTAFFQEYMSTGKYNQMSESF